MKFLIYDFRIALRLFARSPGFVLVAVMTLMLGIGATSTVFTLVDKVLFVPLPHVDAPERIAWFFEENGSVDLDRDTVSTGNYFDWKEHADAFSGVSAVTVRELNAAVGAESERVYALAVSYEFFATTGTPAAVGRVFTAGEDQPGAESVVLLSYGYWLRRFASSMDCIGASIVLDGRSHRIVGVLPRGFAFVRPVDVFVPLVLGPGAKVEHRERTVAVIGRLRPTSSLAAAQDQMNGISVRLARAYPDTNRGWSVTLVPLRDLFIGPRRMAAVALLTASGLVLLIACANVASLLLARATARRREMAIRAALGATRWQLMRQMLVESFMLSLAGASLGGLLALWGIDLAVSAIPSDMAFQFHGVNDIRMDGRCVGFTACVTVMSSFAFGLVPALRASQPDLAQVFKDDGPSVSRGRPTRRLSNMLVAAQVGLASALTICAMVTVDTQVRLQRVALGFDPARLLTGHLHLPEAKYPDGGSRWAASEDLLARIAGLPGVHSAAYASHAPLSHEFDAATFIVEGKPAPIPGQEPAAKKVAVSSGYFATVGIRVLTGRGFDERDCSDGPPVAIISDKLAELRFPNEDPIGKILDIESDRRRRIVGVVANVHDGFRRDNGFLYLPYAQDPTLNIDIILRANERGNESLLVAPLRGVLRLWDPLQPITRIRTGLQLRRDSLLLKQVLMCLFVALGAIAVALAAIGTYGVVASSVEHRRSELAIRWALGASARDLLVLVVRDAMVLLGTGAAVGAVLSALLVPALGRTLDGPPGGQWWVWPMSAASVCLIGLLAACLPIWRRIRVGAPG